MRPVKRGKRDVEGLRTLESEREGPSYFLSHLSFLLHALFLVSLPRLLSHAPSFPQPVRPPSSRPLAPITYTFQSRLFQPPARLLTPTLHLPAARPSQPGLSLPPDTHVTPSPRHYHRNSSHKPSRNGFQQVGA